jgi:hypothetical protein
VIAKKTGGVLATRPVKKLTNPKAVAVIVLPAVSALTAVMNALLCVVIVVINVDAHCDRIALDTFAALAGMYVRGLPPRQ